MDLFKLAAATSRVHSLIVVKEVNDELREFTGIATTPATDRMDDVVNPQGAQYTIPISLLWQHDRMLPVGSIVSATPTKSGIEVRGKIPFVSEPESLRERLDEAWQSLKHGLVRGLSIGFRPLEYEFMDNGGINFKKWEWLELSLVTIPANAEATITSVKNFDSGIAAPGVKIPAVKSTATACVKAKNIIAKLPKPEPVEGQKMNIEEQIKGFKAARAAKAEKMNDLMKKAADEGRGLDAAESEEFDTLEQEIDAVDKQLDRLAKVQKMNLESAKPVTDDSGMQKRMTSPATPRMVEKLEPGIEFARFAMCLGAAKGDLGVAREIGAKRYPGSERINLALKAAVEAGTTTGTTWASPLVEYNQFAGDFIEYLRPQTIIGKFGQGGIPSLRSIPFNVHVRGQTSGGEGYWVGQGAPKPLTKFDFSDAYMGYTKVANISVLTEELLRFSNPSAEMLVRDSLAQALIARLDTDFVDPDKAAVANVSPASITNGVTAIIASGTGDADDVRTDVKAAMTKFINANITPSSGVWIMSATTALALSLMRNTLGQKEFPDITMLGGTFEGLPVIVSEYVAADSNGAFVILANASDIYLADDGGITIDASREASLQMLDNPTNNSASGTATTMVSMFQTNSVAIRAERYINWQKRRTAAVAVIAHVHWGA